MTFGPDYSARRESLTRDLAEITLGCFPATALPLLLKFFETPDRLEPYDFLVLERYVAAAKRQAAAPAAADGSGSEDECAEIPF